MLGGKNAELKQAVPTVTTLP